jgi:hypothetical protein
MAKAKPKSVTLNTVHEDLKKGFADLKGELRAGFGGLKVTLISGFQGLPSRESSEEMIRLLRENNKALIARLDALIRGRGDGSPTS